jgi:AcrR family transcriptional regulator
MSAASPPEAMRDRIIAAAAADIRKMGAHRLAITHLAQALGMSHANVYRHFADKAGLLDAVLNGWLRGIELRLSQIVEGPDPADDKLERYLTALSRAYEQARTDDSEIFALLADGERASSEAIRHRQQVNAHIGRIVDEGIATRLFAGSDGRRNAQLIMDLAYRFIEPQAFTGNLSEPMSESRRDRAIRAILRALLQRR